MARCSKVLTPFQAYPAWIAVKVHKTSGELNARRSPREDHHAAFGKESVVDALEQREPGLRFHRLEGVADRRLSIRAHYSLAENIIARVIANAGLLSCNGIND